MPFFSVIIPLFNKEETVVDSISSILNQSFQDFEIIVVDDGSSDSSVNKVHSIDDGRVLIFSQSNAGPSSARNHGIRKATGEWVVFLDADDQLTKDALQLFRNASKKSPDCSCIYGNAQYVKGGNITLFSSCRREGVIRKPFKEAFFRRLSIQTGASAIKRSVLNSIMFNESLRRMEDAEFHDRIRKDCKCYRIPETTVVVNTDYSQARFPLADHEKDYMFHVDLTGKSFWEKMCLYEVYLSAKNTYHVTGEDLPHNYDHRYILLFLNRLLLKKW